MNILLILLAVIFVSWLIVAAFEWFFDRYR